MHLDDDGHFDAHVASLRRQLALAGSWCSGFLIDG
jgi:hypothetical protein